MCRSWSSLQVIKIVDESLLTEIGFVPINIPRFEPIKKDPETERLEARFQEIIRENEEEKIKNENTGIGGLLGGKI